MSRWKWILSWMPLLAALLLVFTIWTFLLRETGEGGGDLLPQICGPEKSATRNGFEIVWRESGCQAVSSSFVQRASDWSEYWNKNRESINLQELPEGTAIDIRKQTKGLVLWRLGKPGALLWQADSSPQGEYLLLRSLNELALREAFPRGEDLQLLAGALAVRLIPEGDLRLVLSSKERELARSLPPNWAEKFTRCQGRCLETLFPQ